MKGSEKQKRAMHWGKVRYGTQEAAEAGRKDWAQRSDRDALLWLVAPYECPYCHSWHLGRSKAARKAYVKAVENGEIVLGKSALKEQQ